MSDRKIIQIVAAHEPPDRPSRARPNSLVWRLR